MSRDRDRDTAGRPRNSRPRDGLGRPLAASATGEPRIPDTLVLPPADAVSLADELLRSGRPFHAHEVLEASWKASGGAERDLWQGLAQAAVGYTHAHRGNGQGAVTLLRRGVRRVRAYQASADAASSPAPYGMDLTAFLAAADDLAARIERSGLAGIPPADLLPSLATS